MGGHSRRLDSWKEIAEYLGRDVRTAMRWAKSQGLPVRRVGGRGRSVFAFAQEIDAWLAGQQAQPDPIPVAEQTARLRRWPLATAAAVLIIVTIITSAMLRTRADESAPLRASATPEAVTVTDADGTERVVHRFDRSLQTLFSKVPSLIADVDGDRKPDVLVGVAYYDDPANRTMRSGELLNLAPRGGVRWRFTVDDHVRFGESTFRGPWGLTDWQVGPAASPARIAVAAHDYVWWASVAVVLDHDGRRVSTFVNPGWIESLLWLDRDRLVVAGFNNARNQAAVAIVDANRPLGQAPGAHGTPFQCLSCPDNPPLFYATLPRSELNALTASRFNRAQVAWLDDRLLVTTIEIAGDPLAATAHYEFDRDLRLLRAQYDGLYWDAHRRLELEGRLTHSRDTCPERDGPPAIHVWDSAQGWKRTIPDARQ